MRRNKELKQLAKKIAVLEKKLQDQSISDEMKKKCEDGITQLSEQIQDYKEIFILDEYIQDFLTKNFDF